MCSRQGDDGDAGDVPGRCDDVDEGATKVVRGGAGDLDGDICSGTYGRRRGEVGKLVLTGAPARDGRVALARTLDEELLEELPDGSESGPEEALDRRRSVNLAREFLERELDETEKLVFTMHYGDDMPLDAITRLLGLKNRSGAKAYIVSARRKLSRAIGRWKASQDRLDA